MMLTSGYFLLSLGTVCMLYFLFAGYKTKKVAGYLSGILIVWLIYIYLLAGSGVLDNFGLPPRIPLLIVIPCIIAFILLVNRRFMRDSLRSTPLYLPVALQSFRILVELLIYATFLHGVFPEKVTFEGLNFDIAVGLSAIPVSMLVYRKKIGRGGLLAWNVISLCILALTVYAFVSGYYFGVNPAIDRLQFVRFPYILLPSVLLPVALFLHIFSIKQVILKN